MACYVLVGAYGRLNVFLYEIQSQNVNLMKKYLA